MSIASRPLGENLTQTERLFLVSMAHHDGFPVLQKLLDEACRKATEEVMKVDPKVPNYKDILAATQANARAIHEFCEAVRKSFLWNTELGMKEEAKSKEPANARN